MNFMRISTSLSVAAVAVALTCGLALAADAPNIVGTWKSTGDYAAARWGAANDYQPEFTTPTMGTPDQAWTIEIKAQEGRAFRGIAKSPKGGEEQIVGVISHDGEHMLIAGSEAGLFGEFVGDQIEFCYQDQEDNRASVACFVASKQ